MNDSIRSIWHAIDHLTVANVTLQDSFIEDEIAELKRIVYNLEGIQEEYEQPTIEP